MRGSAFAVIFFLLLSHFSQCNCTNTVSHLFPPRSPGPQGFCLHFLPGDRVSITPRPLCFTLAAYKGLEGVGKCPLPASLAQESSLAHTELAVGLCAAEASALWEIPRGRAVGSFKTKVYISKHPVEGKIPSATSKRF